MQIDTKQTEKRSFNTIITSKNENENDIVCDVCLDDDDDEGNEIVICDLCLGAVHQKCYGSELLSGVPEDNWFCVRCRHLKENQAIECFEVKCQFCPDLTGILKPTAHAKIDKYESTPTSWAHLNCVRWLKGVHFKDKKMEVAEVSIKPQPQNNCTECEQPSLYLYNCNYSDCKKQIHIRCAIKQGWIYHWYEMVENLALTSMDQRRPIFCQEHREIGI